MIGGETGRRTGLLIQQKVANPPCGFDSHPISFNSNEDIPR